MCTKFQPKRIVEATLRKAHVDRHLAALKAFNSYARARFLSLDAATRGLALARSNTPANADPILRCAWIIS